MVYVCVCSKCVEMKKNYDLISKSSRFVRYKWVLQNAPINELNVRLCYFQPIQRTDFIKWHFRYFRAIHLIFSRISLLNCH